MFHEEGKLYRYHTYNEPTAAMVGELDLVRLVRIRPARYRDPKTGIRTAIVEVVEGAQVGARDSVRLDSLYPLDLRSPCAS